MFKIWRQRLTGAFALALIGVIAWHWAPLAGQLVIGLAFIMGALAMVPVRSLPGGDGPRMWLRMTCAIAAFAFGLMQLAGVAAGGSDPVAPMAVFISVR